MTFDPATCIHCDPVGEGIAVVIFLWFLWVLPALLFVVRRRIGVVNRWPARIAAGLLTSTTACFTVLALLVSVLWLLDGR